MSPLPGPRPNGNVAAKAGKKGGKGTLEAMLVRAWMTRGLIPCALLPLSLIFRAIITVRRSLYSAGLLRSIRVPVPVVVVGNIFIGGTGKTPLVIWLIEELRRAGWVPGVISRGYRSDGSGVANVVESSPPEQVGDEPALIAWRTGCPVVVGRNRVAAARALLERHPQVNLILSDDGLQHYALQRDVEIVLCDERGNGNGWLLPAGPLREPPGRARDFTVVNAPSVPPGISQSAFRMSLDGSAAYRLSDPAHRVPLDRMAGSGQDARQTRIVAAAGIGHPARFFSMLRRAGLAIDELPLPDHHDFADNPFDALEADIILITEKDAVKCRGLDSIRNDPRIWVVPVAARLDPVLVQQILEKCRGRPTA